MTTVTHTLLDATGTARTGVVVTLAAYDGNKYPAQNSSFSVTATSNGSGALSFTVPDADNVRGRYYRMSGNGINPEPIILVRPGVTTTTVAASQVGTAAPGGDYTDFPNLQAPLTSPAVSGTAYQNTGRRTIQVSLALTPTGAGTATLALGRDGSAFTTFDVRTYSGAGAAQYLNFGLPAGHYYKVTVTGATLGAVVSI